MSKRPFRKLKGTSKLNDDYAIKHNRRPYVFSFTTEDGGTVESQGSVAPEQVAKLLEIFKQLNELHINELHRDVD